MGESQRPSRAGRPPLPDPAGLPLTALILCSFLGSPLSACKSRAPLGKPVPGNGKGDFNHGVGLFVLRQVCFVWEFCPFSNNTTQRTLRKSPGCDRLTVSFYSFNRGKKVGKRKEREEREKKAPRAPPTSFPPVAWVCAIKSQQLRLGPCSPSCPGRTSTPHARSGPSPESRFGPDLVCTSPGWAGLLVTGEPSRGTRQPGRQLRKTCRPWRMQEKLATALICFYVATKRVQHQCQAGL